MADFLIRGISIPRNCFECPLFTNCDACEGHECGCGLLGGIGYEEDISEDRRRDDCPLVELPPHGDLVDRNKLIDALILLAKHENDWRRSVIIGVIGVMDAIGQALVVIPAEEEKHE